MRPRYGATPWPWSGQVAEAERLAAAGRVAAGVAHEIRNPIAAMRLKAEMALRGDERRMIGTLPHRSARSGASRTASVCGTGDVRSADARP